jgi:hypothetical protein
VGDGQQLSVYSRQKIRRENQEIDWISEMIQEKLVDMGYENVSTFSFDINVCFNEEETC